MTVLSIQSSVIFGYVGNNIARPVLQTLGYDVWCVDTVNFSNHPGYGSFTGSVKEAHKIQEEINGLANLDILGDCDAILSGYLGEVETAKTVSRTIELIKEQNETAIYLLDPVIGDDGQIYVKNGLIEAFKNELLPKADVILPNQSELGWLSGLKINDVSSLKTASKYLIKCGAKTVVVTGIPEIETLTNYVVTSDAFWAISTPKLNRKFSGTGDLFSSLFTGALLQTKDLYNALNFATEGCSIVVRETQKKDSKELSVLPVLNQFSRIKKPRNHK
ncbi:pyridoxal kinase [Alphaproteobacteria bacterium]|nr:pyridoxal kinase [Alphaproteobacteria bacterium]